MNEPVQHSEQAYDFAVLMLVVLRDQGFSDDAIIRDFCSANPQADATFEQRQLTSWGHVIAPATEVKEIIIDLIQN
jgi:hypothetical protein